MNHRQLVSTLLAVAVLVGACGDAEDGAVSADPSVSVTSSVPSSSETTTTEPASTSDNSTPADANSAASPARVQLDWVVSVLNDGAQPTLDEIEQHFDPDFLAEIPADQLVAFLPQVFEFAEPPYTVESFEPDDAGLSADAVLLGTDDRRLTAQIVVGATAPNLIAGLGIVPTEIVFPSPITVDAIDERLVEQGPQSSLGLYDVTSGDCKAVHEIRTDSSIVLGSVFKLWVLAALATEIDEGRASWDETMAVTDELRSNPAGEIYQLETGTEVTLERLAEAMISISDNTATDMLIDRLSRQTVEQAIERAGVADPSANIPLLSTGNLFALKYSPDEPNAGDYRALDEAGRRSLLAELDEAAHPWVTSAAPLEELADSTNADGLAIDEPRDLDIEWFATADDLCQTLVHLSKLADTPGLEPVASILEINAGGGIPFDRDRWPTIRFKGGSEAGVIAGAWWFEGPDGDRYVVTGGVANPDEALSDFDTVLTLASAIELID